MTERIGIFADDLTGAVDSAAPLAAAGRRAYVAIRPSGLDDLAPGDWAVLSVNMETRSREAHVAAPIASACAAALQSAGCTILVNKIDSTMRGHPGVELAAALQRTGREWGVLCPAYPANSRTVVKGRLLVGGQEAHRTDVGQDPLSPLADSSVKGIVLAALARAGIDGVDVIETGPPVDDGSAPRTGSIRILLPDAASDRDLDELVVKAAGSRAESGVIVAGSAGLTSALARMLPASSTARLPVVRRPALFIAGSQREVVGAQLRALGEATDTTVLPVELPGDDDHGVLTGPAIEVLALGRNVALRAQLDRSIAGMSNEELRRYSDSVTGTLGEVCREIVTTTPPGALVIVGGDTAMAVLRSLSARGIVLAGELMPGVTIGTVDGGFVDGVTLATKAGAFGDAQTLVRLLELATG